MYRFVIDLGKFLLSISYIILNIYTYFIFVGLLCIDQGQLQSVYFLIVFIVYHALFGISILMYLRLQSVDDASTKDLFPKTRLQLEEDQDLRNCNPFFAAEIIDKITKNLYICRICGTFKPPRAHHCSICGKCYLKFDHHCLLTGTCIVFQNYKFFYQFLFYNAIFLSFTSYVYLAQILNKEVRLWPTINYIVNLSLIGLVLIYNIFVLIVHTYLILNNETTVEFSALNSFIIGDNSYNHVFQEGPIPKGTHSRNRKYLNPYNIGWWKNWREVFGEKLSDWFLPTFSSKGDGVSFPKNIVESEGIEI